MLLSVCLVCPDAPLSAREPRSLMLSIATPDAVALALNLCLSFGRPAMTCLHYVFSLGRSSYLRRNRPVLLQQRAKHCRARYRRAAFALPGCSSSEHLRKKIPPFRCSPSDLEQAVQQLGRMLSEDASSLIDCHILMWRTHPAR